MSKAFAKGLLALAFVTFEAAAQFCPGLSPWVFTDVPSTHPFCTDITWMAQRGVTLGCAMLNATQRLYCPDQGVRRDQMAAFMHRLGDAVLPATCATGQVMKWDGSKWACSRCACQLVARQRHRAVAQSAHRDGEYCGGHRVSAAAGDRDLRGGVVNSDDQCRRVGGLRGRRQRLGQCVRAGRQSFQCNRGARNYQQPTAGDHRERQPRDALRAKRGQPEPDRRESAKCRRPRPARCNDRRRRRGGRSEPGALGLVHRRRRCQE